MTMLKFSRLMEAACLKNSQTQVVTQISRDWELFNVQALTKILAMNYTPNDIGLIKAKKWIAKIFGIFSEELESLITKHGDIGEAIYHLDVTKENDYEHSLSQIIQLLEAPASYPNTFDAVKETILDLSAIERKWFVRYWIKQPLNGINSQTVKTILGRVYKKTYPEVKEHCTFNNIETVLRYYMMGKNPPTELQHGAFIKMPMQYRKPMDEWPAETMCHFDYNGRRLQVHRKDDSIIIFNTLGKIVNKKYPKLIEEIKDFNNCILEVMYYSTDNTGFPIAYDKDANNKYAITDILMNEGEQLLNTPKLKLQSLGISIEKTDPLLFYNQAIAEGFNGIVIKDANSTYGETDILYRPNNIDLNVVILSAQQENGKMTNFEIVVKSNEGFVSLGTIKDGFGEQKYLQLCNSLRRVVEDFKNDTYYFLPRVVTKVEANMIIRSRKGNLLLRQGRFKGIVTDKYVQDIDTIDIVLGIMMER